MKKEFNTIFCLFVFSLLSLAQNGTVKQYYQFKQKAQKEYDDYRKKCNDEYAEFLKTAWDRYHSEPVFSKPKEEHVPPLIMPDEDVVKPIESTLVPIDTVVTPIMSEPISQPKPIVPIYEKNQPIEKYLEFTFFGTGGKVRMPMGGTDAVSDLEQSLNGGNISKAWKKLSNGSFDNLIRDCLELRIHHQLCDWAYLLMIRELCEKYYGGDSNRATLLTSWIYSQSGYQMRLATAGDKLYLLFGSEHRIYDMPNFCINGIVFYPLLHKDEKMPEMARICDVSYPGEEPLSLYVSSSQFFEEKLSPERFIKSECYDFASANVPVNQNLLDFYQVYPTSVLGENFCTRWAMYANTPMANNVKVKLYPQLKKIILGKSDLDAANILLNWVQTGFVYECDDKVWGYDRAFFAEETLYYPYCDCEDRSILYTRLVRDLLGLKCILVYYPGHLACAVQFREQVQGDYINLGGYKFTIADPTYIGAPVGRSMPNMDSSATSVILLQ